MLEASSGRYFCPMGGEPLMKRDSSGEQGASCRVTGTGRDLGRNQKGKAERSVTIPAMM
ncbi:hypothetical protein AAFF_G00061360 [Aldrovandia affinis]|uniref:Uncharacterized protein n=1 Tax=Aldrovandia affinis TaxID=143900 RepID=A0AAD7RZX2_9TELE|nr:hypothetical protein AAFF_G00061360 [Aldrovandia affinis]